MRILGIVAFALAGALAACNAPHAANPGLWTVADVQALYAGGAQADYAVATDAGLPGGVKLEKILDFMDKTKLARRATIAEEYNGAYLTTEVWSHFDEVWLQPMYIPATVQADGTLKSLSTDGSTWIFGVGPGSRFYSPFWQMVYVEVKADTQLTSARQVLDGKYPLHFGPGRTVSLLPDGVSPPDPLTTGRAWVDGRQTSFVDFGKQTFTWNDDAVIDELPIYVFLMRDSTGALVAPDIPTVAGTGPPGSRGPKPMVVNDQNRYATYWRIYTVTLPPTARVFDPLDQFKLGEANVPRVKMYAPIAQGYPEPVGWVALNPGPDDSAGGCFGSDGLLEPHSNTTTGHCIWLDSQAAIEDNIDHSAIQRTDVTVTCPFITVKNADVSPIK